MNLIHNLFINLLIINLKLYYNLKVKSYNHFINIINCIIQNSLTLITFPYFKNNN